VTREAEWDDEQRDRAVALIAMEENRCPNCGGPINECTDPATEGLWKVPLPVRCHRATALAQAQEAYLEANPTHPTAVLWSTQPK
jgi:hypothetical protein